MAIYNDDADQLGLDLGMGDRAEGQARALAGADEWRERAAHRVLVLAVTRKEFTSEEVTAEVGLPTGSVSMNKNNAVGALISECARRGWITPVGYRPAKRRSQHAATLRTWKGTKAADAAATRHGITP